MKKITLLLLLISFPILFSCSSDDDTGDNGSNPSETFYRLVSIESFSPEGVFISTENYQFDSNNEYRLDRIINENSNTIEIFNFSYNSDGQMTDRTIGDDIFMFIYEEDLIVETVSYEDGYNDTNEFIYNTSNQMINSKHYQEGEFSCEENYTYNNQGNVATRASECFGISITVSYEYDNKNSPYALIYPEAFERAFWPINNNNITSSNSNELTYEYEYNSGGYPTQKYKYLQGVLTGYEVYEYETFEG